MTPRSLTQTIRIIIAGTLFLNFIFLVKDLADDLGGGATLWHTLPEILIAMGTVSIAVISLLLLLRQREKSEGLNIRVHELEKLSAQWQQKTKLFSEGLAREIDLQMSNWQLSRSEKEIALLILKGLSNKEIAELRDTSEQTIKQQSSAIYRKSGLANRSELSAFFLEDLLLPVGSENSLGESPSASTP